METREYKCSFGIVKVTIDGNTCTGTYQNNGEFTGTFKDNIVKAKWKNEGKEGLIELDLSDDELAGKWKQGLEEGPMRGKWNGSIIQAEEPKANGPKTYNLIISASSLDGEKEVSSSIREVISKWFTSIGGDFSNVLENNVFNPENYDSFSEFFIPLEKDILKVIPSLTEVLKTTEGSDFWIYFHESINTEDIIMGDSLNYDLESDDNIFLSPSDHDSNEGEGIFSFLFEKPTKNNLQVDSQRVESFHEYEISDKFDENEEYNSLMIVTNPPTNWLSIFWNYVTGCLDEEDCNPNKAVILKYQEDEETSVNGIYFYVDGGAHRVASNVRELSEEFGLWVKFTDLENITVGDIDINSVSEEDMDINWDNYVFIDAGTIDEGEGMIFDWFED